MTAFTLGLSGCGGGLGSGHGTNLLALAERAEALGFKSLWINEEPFQGGTNRREGRTCLSPLILAAAIAARTSQIRIGFSVLVLPLHQPLRLAEEIATLDVLSGGRVDLGISRGSNPKYAAAFGFALPQEGRRCSREVQLQLLLRPFRHLQPFDRRLPAICHFHHPGHSHHEVLKPVSPLRSGQGPMSPATCSERK